MSIYGRISGLFTNIFLVLIFSTSFMPKVWAADGDNQITKCTSYYPAHNGIGTPSNHWHYDYWSWDPGKCTNGVPDSGWISIGDSQNGNGTVGQITCTPTGSGYYYNFDLSGNTTGTANCLYIGPPSDGSPPNAVITKCSYYWPDLATGWRTHTWQPTDCTNGLPQSGSIWIGEASNGSGTGGMVSCTLTTGGHYNHPTVAGTTSSLVECLYIKQNPAKPQFTKCSYYWPEYQTGWRTHNWEAADCSNGLPQYGSAVIMEASNGSGTGGQAAYCENLVQGSHYNHPTVAGVTTGVIECLYAAPYTPD